MQGSFGAQLWKHLANPTNFGFSGQGSVVWKYIFIVAELLSSKYFIKFRGRHLAKKGKIITQAAVASPPTCPSALFTLSRGTITTVRSQSP
jgi:hypothetical protein